MSEYYCSKCNTKLVWKRKALREFSRIIETIDPHICPDTPLALDFTPCPATPYVEKSVQKLDSLHTVLGSLDEDAVKLLPHSEGADLRDRRPAEHTKSSAPLSLLEQMMKGLDNSVPAHDVNEEPSNE